MWRVFAFMDDDETGEHDERRTVADWQLEDVLRWCRFRGYDHIYVTRLNETTRFAKKQIGPDLLRHFVHG